MENLNYKVNKQLLLSALRANLTPCEHVFLCVGSDRITGDCLGPLTGQLLTRNYNVRAYVYGTLEAPVTAKNVIETEKFIRRRHKKCKIIAIDASLGAAEDVGRIRMLNGGILPGSASNKTLPAIGDFSITATVNEGSQKDPSTLFATRLHLVYHLADTIANTISDYVKERQKNG